MVGSSGQQTDLPVYQQLLWLDLNNLDGHDLWLIIMFIHSIEALLKYVFGLVLRFLLFTKFCNWYIVPLSEELEYLYRLDHISRN